MAPPLHLLLALCAPPAMVAFVHTGAFLGAPRAITAGAAATSDTSRRPGWTASSPVAGRQTVGGPQERKRERPSALGPLFAKTPAYDVSIKRSTNSSMILELDLPGSTTQLCYDRAVRSLSKSVGDRIPGFPKNTKHPPEVIEQHFGTDGVKSQALEVVTEDVIQNAIENVDFRAIGSAELIQDPDTIMKMFTPGSPIMLEVKVDVWPEVKLVGEYTGFTLEVEEPPKDEPRIAAAWKGLQERNVVLQDTEEGYAAQLGDSVIANMEPYKQNKDGSKGEKLPQIASGDNVDIILESGRYMPGLAEGMEGVKAGESREIRVTFPDKLGPSGGDLEGTDALFVVEALEIKKRNLPEINEDFAKSIRADLTLEELTKEVEKAVMEESGTTVNDARNRALENALLEVVDVTIPETLIIEQAREKFAIMLSEFRDQGESDEKIQKLITKENFKKYVEVVRRSTTRALSLGLTFEHVASKEGLAFDPSEVEDQLDLMRAQAKGKEFNEAVAKDKIEATLERNLVLDFIAERSTITWVPGRSMEEVLKEAAAAA